VLECWSVGVLECWSVGVLECWSVGVLECWGAVMLMRPSVAAYNSEAAKEPSLHNPTLQDSITPPLQFSIGPLVYEDHGYSSYHGHRSP